MEQQCAPACFSCERLHVDSYCPLNPNEPNAWYPGDLNRMFERIVTEWSSNYTIDVLSRPQYTPGDSENSTDLSYEIGPWIIAIDDFITDAEVEALIAAGQQEGYERSLAVGDEQEDGTSADLLTESRTSKNAWCNEGEACMDHPEVQKLYQRLHALTHIPVKNWEYFQLLHYEV